MAIVQRQVLNPFDQVIGLSTSDGHKIYKDGIKLLDDKLDGTPNKATFFQTQVIDASESRFWATVCKLEFNGEDIDVLKKPGKLTLDKLEAHCDEIWEGDIDDDDTYQNQIRHSMMGTFLIKSITPALHQQIQAKKDQWFSKEHNTIDGLLFYKNLIGYGSIRSRAGIHKNKCKLHALTLKTYDHDIQKMVDDFTTTLGQIKLKGEEFTEELMHLFKAFETSHNPIFKTYIQSMKDKWDKWLVRSKSHCKRLEHGKT